MPPSPGTHWMAAYKSTRSLAMTENLWKRTQAGDEYPRVDTSVISGSTRNAGQESSHSNQAKKGG